MGEKKSFRFRNPGFPLQKTQKALYFCIFLLPKNLKMCIIYLSFFYRESIFGIFPKAKRKKEEKSHENKK